MSEEKVVYIDLTNDIQFEHVSRIRYHDDEISIGLKSHLLVEYLLNRIVVHKLKFNPEKVTFSKKLKALYSDGLIPDYILQNINKLNLFRNQLVHSLNYELPKNEMTIVNKNGENKSIKTSKKRYPERHYLKMLGHCCLGQLRRHMIINLKIDPRYFGDVKV